MRYRVVRFSYFVFVALIVIRLAYWQIIKSDDLIAQAETQRVRTQDILAPRGSILFSDGSVLASIQPSFQVFAQPKIISDKLSTAKALSQIFWQRDATISANLTPEEELDRTTQIDQLSDQINKKISQDLYWVSLNQTVNWDTKQAITKLNLPGIGFDQNYQRFYPEGSSSAHMLGFVGSDVYGNQTGYFGLEGTYNGELKGLNGQITQETDAQGLPILIGKYSSRDPKSGKNLVLNIDPAIQHMVESELLSGIEKYGAKGAEGVVMDPKTGAILAMASYPNYDPAKPANFPKDYFKNPVIADTYEPGSTFKVLVMAAAINENLVTPATLCTICGGPVNLGGFTIRTWNNEYEPNSSMDDVIIHSDNVGMVFISQKMGLDRMYSYIRKFGFGDLTGIDLQDEESPDLRPKADWHDIDVATASFGQGISVTPIQLVRAIATIANGGKLMEPHLVSQIKDGDRTITIPPRVISQPISAQAAQVVTQMMVDAVNKGEAKFYSLKGFNVAGKTGTAQIPIAGHYDPTKTIASFVGFAPAEDPKFVMLIKYDQPSSSIYGAETAAPSFFKIAQNLFTYYGILPTEH